MNSPDAIEIEGQGAKRGLNPMFGDWSHSFKFAPVPYGNGRALAEFRNRVRTELTNKFVYTNEIQVTITLYLDLQNVLETSDTADVDNYAKGILDCLKGPDGIMLDDTQVQALTISWLDYHETFFEVQIRGGADDFALKPVTFYEMPDGLWYPQSRSVWSIMGPEELDDFNFYSGLFISHMSATTQKTIRRTFRKLGLSRLKAYQTALPLGTLLRGFHKSRIVDAGWEMVTLRDWTAAYEQWKPDHADKVAILERMVSDNKARWDSFEEKAAERR